MSLRCIKAGRHMHPFRAAPAGDSSTPGRGGNMLIGSAPCLALEPLFPAIGQLTCVPIYQEGSVVAWGNGEVIERYEPGAGLPADSPESHAYAIVRITATGGPWTGTETLYHPYNMTHPIESEEAIPMSNITLTQQPPTMPAGDDVTLPTDNGTQPATQDRHDDDTAAAAPDETRDQDRDQDAAEGVATVGEQGRPTAAPAREFTPEASSLQPQDGLVEGGDQARETEQQARLAEQQAQLAEQQVAELTGQVERLQQEARDLRTRNEALRQSQDEARRQHRTDVDRIGERLLLEAEENDLCEVFDRVVEDLNRQLFIELPERCRTYHVTCSVEIVVQVEASSEEAARDAAEEKFDDIESEVDDLVDVLRSSFDSTDLDVAAI
jgi:hypothetical protein